MAFWVEVHCDVMAPNGCHSLGGIDPGVKAMSATDAAKAAVAHAKKLGWKKTRRGWECPYCQKQPTPAAR